MKRALGSALLKIADEVWIATALLHPDNPKRKDFSVSEIVARARREDLSSDLRPGVQIHAYLHCVANLPPNPGRYRMLYATGKSTRRLFRETDDFHPERGSGKVTPHKEDIPARYHSLLDWYRDKFIGKRKSAERDLGRRRPGRVREPTSWRLGVSRIFWDTNLFIYLIEDHGDLSERVAQLRKRMIERSDNLYTSVLTLGEILVTACVLVSHHSAIFIEASFGPIALVFRMGDGTGDIVKV